MTIKSIVKNQKGFTIIEIVMALVLLAIAGTIGSEMMFNASNNSLNTKDRNIATKLAEQTLDELIATKAFGGFQALEQEHMGEKALFAAPYNKFFKQVSVIAVNPGNISGNEENPIVYNDPLAGEDGVAWDDLRKVNITVSWNEGGQDSVNLSTILSNHGRI